MLKILIIGHLPIDLSKIKGGVEAVIFNMLEGYNSINTVDVQIFSLSHETKKIIHVNFSDNISIHYYPYGFTKSTKLGTLLSGRKYLKKNINEYNPDIIHFQGNGSQLLLTLGLDSKNLVITPHGMLKEEYKHAYKFMTKINLIMAIGIESLLIKKFRNFIFIADYAKNYYLETYKYLNNSLFKYEIISNPLTQKFFTNTVFTQKINNLVFIGGIAPRKGLDLLLFAIQKIKIDGYNVLLTVIGGFFDDTYKAKIYMQIDKLGIADSINFVGWQKQDKVYELLKKSDCFILPSKQETLPISIMEAMAMGKIVISSDVGGCPEMIKNNVNGFLFKKGDMDDLTKILLVAIKSTNLLLISKNAHSTAKERYQSNKVTERVIAVYNSINENNL